MRALIILLTMFVQFQSFLAQNQEKYPQAPEIWSKPEAIETIQTEGLIDGISVTSDGKKIYLDLARIAEIELSDTGWTAPKYLPSHINANSLVRRPCISPNGKKLIFSWFVGEWQLFYSDWDSLTGNWGDIKNCGESVNGPDQNEITGALDATMPNDSTLIFTKTVLRIADWDKKLKRWVNGRYFPSPIEGYPTDAGAFVADSMKKMYLVIPQLDTTITGEPYRKEDFRVDYLAHYDSSNNEYVYYYSKGGILNISYQADTLYFKGEYSDRWHGFPSLTADGKTLFFVAKYYDKHSVYYSHMLIDENGNPVTSVRNEKEKLPLEFKLNAPYPNPFNAETVIEYKLNKDMKIELVVFDLLGRKVREVTKGFQSAGEYKSKFDAKGLTSGVYLVSLNTPYGYTVQKTILLK